MKRVVWIVLPLIAAFVVLQRMGYDVTVGGVVLGQEDLERWQQSGQQRSIIIIGGVVLQPDVSPELAAQTINRMVVVGGMVADKAVLQALENRLVIVGAATGRE
jgi:predicted SpoU family rRNA methylase